MAEGEGTVHELSGWSADQVAVTAQNWPGTMQQGEHGGVDLLALDGTFVACVQPGCDAPTRVFIAPGMETTFREGMQSATYPTV